MSGNRLTNFRDMFMIVAMSEASLKQSSGGKYFEYKPVRLIEGRCVSGASQLSERG
jgi:hypothetical protein